MSCAICGRPQPVDDATGSNDTICPPCEERGWHDAGAGRFACDAPLCDCGRPLPAGRLARTWHGTTAGGEMRNPLAGAHRETVQVEELPAGWRVSWPHRRHMYSTAAAAAAAIKRRGRLQAGKGVGGGAVITVIEWQPLTAVGRAVVKAITG